MLKNYLLIAWRHLRRGRLFSFINIAGLAMGMAIALLIGLWVWDEVHFDHSHRNHERLGEVLSITRYNGTLAVGAFASVPMAAALQSQYPDDLAALSVLAETGETLRVRDQSLGGSGAWVQADFPAMFSLPMINGSVGALKDPATVLLNASMAKGLFGSVDVVGRSLVMGDSTALVVGGVYADLPENSSLAMYQYFLPWENIHNPGRESEDDWMNLHFQLFVQLKEGRDFAALSAKVRDLSKSHSKGGLMEMALHPMDKWHLYDRPENGKMTGGRLQSVWLFGLIGLFVLLLACINFMNLSTAKSEKRAMETGIRKVLGSSRGQLVLQFLGESMLTAFLALLLALLLVVVSLSWFGGMAGRPVPVPWTSPLWWAVLLGFTAFVGIVAGSYPAFYLSAFQPGKIISGRRGSLARKVLVVGQFAISIGLIIGTIFVYRQLQYAKDRPVGYSREGLITIPVNRPGLMDHADVLRQELLRTGAIADLAVSSSPTTEVHNSMLNYDWEGRDPRTVPAVGTLFVGYRFGRTIGWEMAEGRDFVPGSAADSGAFILNEAAVRFTGLKNPVGKVIHWHGVDYPIVGVVQDLVMESPYQPVSPVFFMLWREPIRQRYLVLRMASSLPVKEALARIETVYRRWNPVDAFNYTFVDEQYGRKFLEEEQIGKLAAVFGVLAVVISCLGLFGLATFVAERRTKETGIRKVLGASVLQLWGLLSKEFVVLVGVAFFIAAPVAWLFLHRWLSGYPYHVAISMWVFVLVGCGGLAVALLTVSAQAIRAATANPVVALRSE